MDLASSSSNILQTWKSSLHFCHAQSHPTVHKKKHLSLSFICQGTEGRGLAPPTHHLHIYFLSSSSAKWKNNWIRERGTCIFIHICLMLFLTNNWVIVQNHFHSVLIFLQNWWSFSSYKNMWSRTCLKAFDRKDSATRISCNFLPYRLRIQTNNHRIFSLISLWCLSPIQQWDFKLILLK